MMAELQAKGAVNFDVTGDILWYRAGFKLGCRQRPSLAPCA
jgi:hypothetical protein